MSPRIVPNSDGRTVPVEALSVDRNVCTGRDSVGAEIAAHLEKLIVIGELAGGDRLPSEREPAIHMGVSRASLREATTANRSALQEVLRRSITNATPDGHSRCLTFDDMTDGAK